MATNELKITGLDELREALKALPPELVHEADVIVRTHAAAAANQIADAYPYRTGNLIRGLSVESRGDAVSAVAIIRNRAFHAYIYESGTKAARHWANGKNTGRMPAAHTFVPIVVTHRRAMNADLVALVERAGFTVTGSIG